jgi:phage gp36-like protein
MALPVQYATAGEFDTWAMPSQAYRGVTTPEKNTSLQYASRIAAGYVGKRKVLPLLTWGEDLKAAVCEIAAFDLMSKRGFPPTAGADQVLRERRDDAVSWLVNVSKGLVELVDCLDSSVTPEVDQASPLMAGDPIVSFNYQTRGNRSSSGCCGGGFDPTGGMG